MCADGRNGSELFRKLLRLFPRADVEDYYKQGVWDVMCLEIDIELLEKHRQEAGAPEPPLLEDIPEVVLPEVPLPPWRKHISRSGPTTCKIAPEVVADGASQTSSRGSRLSRPSLSSRGTKRNTEDPSSQPSKRRNTYGTSTSVAQDGRARPESASAWNGQSKHSHNDYSLIASSTKQRPSSVHVIGARDGKALPWPVRNSSLKSSPCLQEQYSGKLVAKKALTGTSTLASARPQSPASAWNEQAKHSRNNYSLIASSAKQRPSSVHGIGARDGKASPRPVRNSSLKYSPSLQGQYSGKLAAEKTLTGTSTPGEFIKLLLI